MEEEDRSLARLMDSFMVDHGQRRSFLAIKWNKKSWTIALTRTDIRSSPNEKRSNKKSGNHHDFGSARLLSHDDPSHLF
jgi:hypothetical protein